MYKIKLSALMCQEPFNDSPDDHCRVEVWLDGIHTWTVGRKVAASEMWNLNKSYWYDAHAEIRLCERDHPSLSRGMGLGPSARPRRMKVLSVPGRFTYMLDHQVEHDPAHRLQESLVEVEAGAAKREVKIGRKQGLVDLRLKKGGKSWEQSYVQSDVVENGCGPAAGMNLLTWWAGKPNSDDLAALMRTNNWDTAVWVAFSAAVVGLGFLNPLLAGPLAALGSELGKFGTLTNDLVRALKLRAPQVRSLRHRNMEGRLTEITDQLRRGRPVIVLYSPKEWGLHWAVVTGTYINNGTPTLRIANGADKSWSIFQKGWKLNFPDPVRELLSGVLGLKPYTMVWYQ